MLNSLSRIPDRKDLDCSASSSLEQIALPNDSVVVFFPAFISIERVLLDCQYEGEEDRSVPNANYVGEVNEMYVRKVLQQGTNPGKLVLG